jgi:zinc protease
MTIPTWQLRAVLPALAPLLWIGCGTLSETTPAQSEPAASAPAPLEPTASVEGVTEYRLPNGLKLLLFPDPSVAKITVNVTYLVGSRHEGRGEGGMAHLLEHMVFKGTPTYPTIWGALQDRGAQFNGTTSYDRTNYFETLQASEDNLDFALKMEADRMVNSRISAEDLATEMTVVRNEFESGENSTTGILFQRMLATAYLFHSYGRPTIGNQSDIERVPVEKLRAFYRTYYQPDNAVVIVAGNFDPKLALAKVQQYFGVLPRPERKLEDTYTVEPTQDGAREVQLSRVGSASATGLMYHIPAATHPDLPALDVLAGVLGDPASGRLYKALVVKKRAASASAFAYSLREPGVFGVYASVALDQDPEKVQRALVEQVEKVAGSVQPDEVERARNRLLNQTRKTLRDSRDSAQALSEAEAVGDWRLLFIDRDRVAAVTADDVNRVARTYLLATNRTAGLFRPSGTPQRADIPQAPALASILESYKGAAAISEGAAFEATPANIERSTQRTKVGGIALALLPKKTRGEVIVARMRLWYGTEQTLRGREAAAAGIGPLMLRGTAKRDYQGIRDALDAIETDLSIGGAAGALDVSLKTTRTNLPAALELLSEILRTPSFPAAELEIARKQLTTQLEAQMTDPQARLFNALQRAIAPHPRESPLYRPTLEEQIERARTVTRDQIADLHRRFLGAGHMQASFVGDFDPEMLEQALEPLSRWTSKEPQERIAVPLRKVEPLDTAIDTPDKKMATVGRGTAFRMRTDDPDYPALDFANYLLGESPKSRLFSTLRQEAGLSYGARSYVQVPDEDEAAYLIAFAIAAPQNARRAQTLMREQFARWLEQPISADELAEFRKGYAEEFKTRLGEDAALASQLLVDLRLGRPFTFHEQIVERVLRLDPEKIQQAIRTHLASAPFVDLAAGDLAKFGEGSAAPIAAPLAR